MDAHEYWTLFIAAGALALALVSLGWNVYLHAIAKPKVIVTAAIMKMYPTPIGLSEDDDVLIVEAVNVRSRPVTIKGFYGQLLQPKDGRPHFFITGSCEPLAMYASIMPCQLKEGDVAKIMILLREVDDPMNVKCFFAGDTTGKNWYTKKCPLRRWVTLGNAA